MLEAIGPYDQQLGLNPVKLFEGFGVLQDIKFIENRYGLLLEEAHLSLIDLTTRTIIYSFHPLPHHLL